MANEARLWNLPAAEANADLSTKQFYCMKVVATDPPSPTSTKNRVTTCTVAGEPFIGVLQNKPNAAGEAAEVMVLGVTKVSADAALSPGQYWGTSADGQAQVLDYSNTGADVRSYAAGVVLEGASAAGELATVTIGFGTFQVSA